MSSHYNRIINYSNPKNRKQITIKNMHGMYDPAFQSNNTLKEYINKKLSQYKNISKYNNNPHIEDLLKSKEKEKSKKKGSSNRNKQNNKSTGFNDYSFYSRTQIENLSHYNNNASLNNLRKNKEKKNKSNRTNNNNNYYVFRCSNNPKTKVFDKLKLKKNKNKNKIDSDLDKNKMNNYFNIILTPNNNSNKECNKTTPINPLNKIKGIYQKKNILLNKSYKSHSRDYTSIYKRDKEIYILENFNSNKNMLKKEIYNIINHKSLNKTYLKENSNHTNNNSKSYNENIICNNYIDFFQDENTDKYKDLLLKDESLNESECPVPMPYVKKYSDYIDKENISNNTINILNNKNLNDLNEPKEEKNIPFPVIPKEFESKLYGNNHKKFIYMKQSKFLKKNL